MYNNHIIYRCQETAEIIAKNIDFTKELIPNKLLLEAGEVIDIDDMNHKESQKICNQMNKIYETNDKELNPFIRLEKYVLTDKKYTKK